MLYPGAEELVDGVGSPLEELDLVAVVVDVLKVAHDNRLVIDV